MDVLGKVNNRVIQYLNVRTNSNWFDELPTKNWIVFTIADMADQELLNAATMKCLDKGVLYACCAGQLASETEDYFISEIAWRETQKEVDTNLPADFDKTPMFSFHRDFNEGFWFATNSAFPIVEETYLQVDTVVCLDFTIAGVKNDICELIRHLNENVGK